MKKSIAMIVLVTGMTAAASSVMAAEPVYIPWSFDDFDSNCEVINSAESQPVVLLEVEVITDDAEAGELGW